MSKVMTYSRKFLKGHPRAGQPTHFVEAIWKGFSRRRMSHIQYAMYNLNGHAINYDLIESFQKSIVPNWEDSDIRVKKHTIRAGNNWAVGDKFSPRVWSGIPRQSKQITICEDFEVKRVVDVEITNKHHAFWVRIRSGYLNNYEIEQLANNDGLSLQDFKDWFNKPVFEGKIIIWNDTNLPY